AKRSSGRIRTLSVTEINIPVIVLSLSFAVLSSKTGMKMSTTVQMHIVRPCFERRRPMRTVKMNGCYLRLF
ncbi:hypothetical protein FRB98_008570, partial [Tulasnella sp. 332]